MRTVIADLQVELQCHKDTHALAAPYAVPAEGAADMLISPAEYATLPLQPPDGADPAVADYVNSGALFGRKLISFDGMVLHACAVVHAGRAYLFSAPSGTGKSTHARLWCARLADCYILNDDKPAIRVTDGVAYAYGTPWSGKDHSNKNAKLPLGGICFLHRGEQDQIRAADAAEALVLLYAQTAHTALSQTEMDKLLATLERLIRAVPIYRLTCTPTLHAAEVSYQAMVCGACDKNGVDTPL